MSERVLMRDLARLGGVAVLALALAGCGGSDEKQAAAAPPGSLRDRLAAEPGDDVGLIMGTSDFAVGANRISFLVVGNNGKPVTSKTATVFVGRTLESRPQSSAPARLLPLDPHGSGLHTQQHAQPDMDALYVTRLNFPEPGRYWLVVDLPRTTTQGMFVLDVKPEPAAPAVGEKAPPSDNPTLDDAPAEQITTARPPDRDLLRSSVRQALRDKVPFVVVFATPAYCTSRTCGPTVEIVAEVQRRLAGTGVRFIHVEVYEDNDPQKGVNRWMKEWELPTEPWIFVVDRKGIIRERFEGSASVEELEAAVRRAA